MKLQLQDIGRCDNGVWRLQNFTYSFESGKVVGLIGNNGAGKTTLLRILAGQMKPSVGTISFQSDGGAEGQRADFVISSCIDLESGYPNFSGHEMMCYIAAANGFTDEKRILKKESEWGVPAEKKIREYSLGMKVRLNLAMTMLKDPRVLLLDEVFNGLDPSGQMDCRTMLTSYARKDCLVIVSSHSLYDIAEISDEILFLENGKIVNTLQGHTDVHMLVECFHQNEGKMI